MKVFKFGGASIKDAASVKNVASILHQHHNESLIIVVSAMGKTTNALEKVVESFWNKDGKAFDLLIEIKKQHYDLIAELFDSPQEVYDDVNDAFVEIEWAIEDEPYPDYDHNYDQIVAVGELVSSKIIAAYLQKEEFNAGWLDARDIILTDNLHREAWVQWDQTVKNAQKKAAPLLEKHQMLVTQGFIGATSENFNTTLGREGSDYTAAIFSYCLDAESMSIWKDVPGVLTADPRKFDNVIKIDNLSYKEAIEMTYYGAKVIHPKTIKPLQNKSIPLYVKSFVNPAGAGTYISDDVEDNYPPMVAIEEQQALLNISTRDFSFVAEHHMSYLFSKISEMRLQINMMQNTAISFSICVNDIDNKVDQFAKSIEENFKVKVERGLELVTVRHFSNPVLDELKERKIVLLESRLRNTVQMVTKTVPVLKRKN